MLDFVRLKGLAAFAVCFAVFAHFALAEPINEKDYAGRVKVACVGDSITFGAGIRDRARMAYPVQLGRMLGEKWDVRNFGVSARTMLKKGDNPYWQTDQFRQAGEFEPDAVIIKLGTNDTKPQNWQYAAEFAVDYGAMVDHFAGLPSKPRIFLCRPVPAFPERWGIRDTVIRDEVIPVVDGIAKEKALTTVDLYTPFEGKAELFPDKIHPNAEGAGRMAEVIFRELTGRDPGPFPGKKGDFHGFDRYDFTVGGNKSIVVVPKDAATGRPWIWRARFFGHEPQTDVALLELGFHVVYCDVGNLFGAPAAVALWDRFYAYLTQEHGFSRRPALEGMSRGGLIIFNWAAANPDKVACIYADAPVCDFKSWPRKKSQPVWQDCLKAYGLTEEQALSYDRNPIDNLRPLAEAGIFLFHVCGAADSVVPVAENTAIVEQRYRALGGRIEVILKPDCEHHPHSLKDPKPIVDFVLKHTTAPESRSEYRARSDLRNSRIRFGKEKKGRVAFIGGSITQMDGYRPRVCAALTEQYPDTEFDFINAGISSTCSTTGAFRLERDVFANGPVDLLFVEFAVNDNQDAGHTPAKCIRGMEGIVRHARTLNPAIDIVLLYCVNDSHREAYLRGIEAQEIAAHKRVAEAYGLCEVNFAAEIAERMRAGEFDWKTFGGCHPSQFGNDLYAASIRRLIECAGRVPLAVSATVSTCPMPETPLDACSYAAGRFLPKENAKLGEGWSLSEPDWKSLPGSKRDQFLDIPLLHSATPGAELTVSFEGTALALYVLAGPDAGTVEFAIDGEKPREIGLFHRFSRGLHYPRTVVLADELSDGKHSAIIRVSSKHDKQSKGAAIRILEIGVNATTGLAPVER